MLCISNLLNSALPTCSLCSLHITWLSQWWGCKSLASANKQHRCAVQVYIANTEMLVKGHNSRLTIAITGDEVVTCKSLVRENKQHWCVIRVYHTANTEMLEKGCNSRLTVATREQIMRLPGTWDAWYKVVQRASRLYESLCYEYKERWTGMRLVQDHVGLYEGRKLMKWRREYNMMYYKRLDLTSLYWWAAGKIYEKEEINDAWQGCITALEIDEGVKSFKTTFS